ncbi:MAG: homoserine dehydrogenase [Clostridia bacterium]|nr:homoserine dehydrogenase [Clostridia bacterium]
MKNIAVIGYGVVGGGITTVIEENCAKIRGTVGDDVCVKYILDLRDFPDSPYADRVVHTIDPILADESVELVCETMGGSHPAFEYSVSCMKAGKSVVTSNKEVVANFGAELLACARENGVQYMFEASVGGGIPVIRGFNTALAGDRISAVNGILNGTTNYILTKMRTENRTFDDVLAEAQVLGYAERDPSADIDGIDAKRKIMILTALASGKLVSDTDVYTETLRNVSVEDIRAAEKWGGAVKLIAGAAFDGDMIQAQVCPMFVPWSCPLSHISDVYNGISVTSPVCGDVMFYGRGAGRLPTAGAVVADVCAVLSGAAKAERVPVFEKAEGCVKPFDEVGFRCYIRASESRVELCEAVSAYCDGTEVLSDEAGVVELITGKLTKPETDKLRAQFAGIESVIRVLG